MKKRITFILVLVLFSSFSAKAYAGAFCSSKGYTVLTVNGIFTNEVGAIKNKDNLKSNFRTTYNNQPLTFDYLYNPTHGIITDLLDSANQKYFDQNSFNIEDSDFAQMLTDASSKVTTQKVLLVAHSQGNFYANSFYDAVADQPGGVPSRSIGVYGVASPSNHVAGNGLYLTSDSDGMIAKFVAKFPLAGILKPNTHIDFKNSDDGGLGHDFSKIYLAYQGNKIVSDIKSSLSRLKENDEQDSQGPCISPPKLTLTQKIQGKILALTDPVSIPVQNTLVAVSGGAINVAGTIVNGIYNAGLAVKNTASGLLASVVNSSTKSSGSPATPNLNVLNSTTATANNSSTKKNSQYSVQSLMSQNISTINNPTLAIAGGTSSFSNIPFVGMGRGGGSVMSAFESEDVGDTSGGDTGTNDGTGGDSSEPIQTPTPDPVTVPTSDATPPVITVLGDNPASVTVGATYADAGATALDDVDGTRDIVTTGTVDTTTAGAYTITYTATDLSGNIGTATRTVNVVLDTDTPVTPPPTPVVPPPSALNTTTIDKDTTLSPGEYNYENLLITNNATLTLEGDPASSNSFKGVKINAVNITVDPGSFISADGKGYGAGQGPGASTGGSSGASYGGLYGSATKPLDLGSGGASNGGGAIYLNVSDMLTDNGIISADGNASSSGGSIYVVTNNVAGNGIIHADGGCLFASGYFKSPGGGGRIALHYKVSTFNGKIESKGGCGSYDGMTLSCAQSGTVGLFDDAKNDLYLNGQTWNFVQVDAPFNFNNIYISNGTKVTSDNGVTITANNLVVDKNSTFTLADNQVLNIPTITISGGSSLVLPGSETITANTLTVDGVNSMVTIVPQKILSLNIPNINVNAGAFISADGKGYGAGQGPGASTGGSSGASYGGFSLGGASYSTTYGSATNPVDFGSGGSQSGGGAIKLTVSNTLKNDGMISAIGGASGSGGSINVNAKNLAGTGNFSAEGGALYANGYFKSPGGGGRVAIYYQTSSFSGVAEAKGGCGSYDGWSKTCAEDGTVNIVDESVTPPPVVPPPLVLSSLKAITAFSFSNLTPSVVGTVDETNHAISLTVPFGTDVTTLVPTIVISDKASVSPDNNLAQNFINPVTYTVTAEDASTQNYIVTVNVAPDPNPPVPDTTPPSIASYTLNGNTGDITINPTKANPLSIVLNASENVNWMTIKIENQSDSTFYKMFQSSKGCVDGTSTCTKSWDGTLSSGGLLQNGTYKIRVHIQDAAKNNYEDYLPSVITINTSM